MLPDDFTWSPRHQYAEDELALVCDGRYVAMLMRGVDGRWVARLWAHWPVTEPVVSRKCSSLKAGRAGIEAWAARHQVRLRAELETGRRLSPPAAVERDLNLPESPSIGRPQGQAAPVPRSAP